MKREANRLQDIGRRLTELKSLHLDRLSLDDTLLHAIREHHRFPSREAKRRQLQYIGRLMRNIDVDDLVAKLEQIEGSSAQAKHTHREAEQWRARILSDNDGITEFIAAHPHTDRQELRQLVKRARAQHDEHRAKALQRELFRFIHETCAVNRNP